VERQAAGAKSLGVTRTYAIIAFGLLGLSVIAVGITVWWLGVFG
jgi:hypothetical protein